MIRHGGAKHLKSSSVHMSWFTYLFLDVIGLIISLAGLFVILVHCLIIALLYFLS